MDRNAALITAAGTSSRMGGTKKEYQNLDGEPVLVRVCRSFLEVGRFSHILLTVPSGHRTEVGSMLAPLRKHYRSAGIEFTVVEGGERRSNSVLIGLEKLTELSGKEKGGFDFVLIHDGARPWCSSELVRSVLDAATRYGAAAPGIPPIDATKLIDAEGNIETHLSRSNTVSIQTPQGFDFQGILSAHRKAQQEGVVSIDDTELYHRYVGPVHVVNGSPSNRKITFPHDLLFLERHMEISR
ncbi:MAG: 2-C-methyl-D-erythritol 4-phosphate cytidylyltransferase [Spirochaetales bacterium]|nr:2-C-methyl-D-erythritol 4-phosphate cytidylyltransferase [Spirochaetales bacterium]MCF7937364.1 2-C-methyl-D-erythritol 4-phosphate cytidylyltransferase [Spirochaetales bacterium]